MSGPSSRAALPRVLLVVAQYHPVVGGVEKQAQRLAEGLVRRGLAVSVLTGRPPGTPRREVIGGVPVRRLTYLAEWKFGPAKFHVQVLAALAEMWQRRESYDLIHVHQAHWLAFAGILAGQRLKKPCVVTVHNTAARFDLRVLGRFLPGGAWMGRYIACNADRFVAISRAIAEELRAWGVNENRIVYISNGVPIPARWEADKAPARRALGLPEHGFLILFVGSLRTHKRPDVALAAFRLLHREVPEARMIFLGDGPMRCSLARQAALLPGGAVIWAGQVMNVTEYLVAADALVLPSDVEGLPLALLEGMAHGLACVGTVVPGIVELLRHGETGFLVPPRDAVALADALRTLARDRSLCVRLGNNARDFVRGHFDLEAVLVEHIRLYQHLVAAEKRGAATSCHVVGQV